MHVPVCVCVCVHACAWGDSREIFYLPSQQESPYMIYCWLSCVILMCFMKAWQRSVCWSTIWRALMRKGWGESVYLLLYSSFNKNNPCCLWSCASPLICYWTVSAVFIFLSSGAHKGGAAPHIIVIVVHPECAPSSFHWSFLIIANSRTADMQHDPEQRAWFHF